MAFNPDEQVQGVVRLIFEQFERIGTINGVLKYLVAHDSQMARQLERQWEAALRQQADLQEAFARFETTKPSRLTSAERAQIQQLAHDLPALWHAATTTGADLSADRQVGKASFA